MFTRTPTCPLGHEGCRREACAEEASIIANARPVHGCAVPQDPPCGECGGSGKLSTYGVKSAHGVRRSKKGRPCPVCSARAA